VSPLVVGDDSVAITQCGDQVGPGLLTQAESVDQYKWAAVAAVVSDGKSCIPTLERRSLHPNPPILSELCLGDSTTSVSTWSLGSADTKAPGIPMVPGMGQSAGTPARRQAARPNSYIPVS
jgi:hypothetical protein